jgi:hypothetical protein
MAWTSHTGFGTVGALRHSCPPMSDLSLDVHVSIRPDVLHRDLDAESVILNLETGVYQGLNATGSRMWALMAQGRTLREVLNALKVEYDVDEQTLERDLLALVEDLRASSLVDLVR